MMSSRCPRPDGHERVDDLHAGVQRLIHRPPVHDARCRTLDRHPCSRDDRPAAVQRLTHRIDDASEYALARGHSQQVPGAPHLAALTNARLAAEQDDSNRLLLQRERQPQPSALELDDLLAADVAQTGHQRDAVADSQHAPGVEERLDDRHRVRYR